MTARPSLAARASGRDRLLGPALLLAGLMLGLGWTLPIVTVRRFLILESPVSILGGITVLWQEQHVLLALLVGGFSVAAPALKLGLAIWHWYGPGAQSNRLLTQLERLGRWAMLDVFVVALGVVAIHVSLIGSVLTQPGLYCFVAGVLGSMLALTWLERARLKLEG